MSWDDPRWGIIGVAFTLVGTTVGVILALVSFSDPKRLTVGVVVAIISVILFVVIFLLLRKRRQEEIELHFQISDSYTNIPLMPSR